MIIDDVSIFGFLFLSFIAGSVLSPAIKRGMHGKVSEKKAIAGIDWGTLKARARKRHEWSEERADAAFDGPFDSYREFLIMCRRNPKEIFAPISDDMDIAWHEHIIDTRMYERDCRRLFGRILHHLPTTTGNEPFVKEAFVNTSNYRAKARRPDQKRTYPIRTVASACHAMGYFISGRSARKQNAGSGGGGCIASGGGSCSSYGDGGHGGDGGGGHGCGGGGH